MRRPRLFGVMVLAFALAIVLGVCGMVGFAALALTRAAPAPDAPGQVGMFAEALGAYYLANGRSWAGVERRLAEPPFSAAQTWLDITLVDVEGEVVASTTPAFQVGMRVPGSALERALPVTADGQRVGTLILVAHSGPPGRWGEGQLNGPPPFLRSLAAAGLGLVLVLVTLAVVFAGWLSRPLRRLTAAAGELASGRLDVRVPGAGVRELDDLAQAFNRMAQSLADADRLRRQMTADIAHELRTPLTIIKGRLEGLQDGVYEASAEQIERLLAEADLLERLIDDLRLLALAEAGQLRLYRELVAPTDLLHDAAAAFANQAREAGVELRVISPDDLPQLDADPQRMAQVLANLVSNALRHTPRGGTITLSAELRGHPAHGAPGSVLLRVTDTGAGIAPEDLPHIFERFWRTDPARARTSGGAGLGLAIARQIVAAHGGTIRAESERGRGTTITIELPLQPEQLYDAPAGQRSAAR